MPKPPPSPACGTEGAKSGMSGYDCTIEMAKLFDIHYKLVQRKLHVLAHCRCTSCSSWHAIGFATRPSIMTGATAFVRVPEGGVKMYALNGKTPSEVTENRKPLHGAWTEVIDGFTAMHFSFDIATGTPLDAIHMLFAGGKSSKFSYHGSTRGGLTLNLLGKHYTHHAAVPPLPSPPNPPSAPSCFLDGTEETVADNLPCSTTLADGVQLDYALDETHLRAELTCSNCDPNGWVALGFPTTVVGVDSEGGAKTTGAAVLGFPHISNGDSDGSAWSLKNLNAKDAEKNVMKKNGGKDKGYDAVATSPEANALELIATAPFAKEWFRLCLTTLSNDGAACKGGALIGMHPKKKLLTGCSGSNKFIGKWARTDKMSLRYYPEKGEIVLRKGFSILRTCTMSGASAFYAKVFVHRRGTSIANVKLVTAPQSTSMVKRHTIGSRPESDLVHFTEMAPSLQTLANTNIETLDGAVTMSFRLRLGENGVPSDLHTAPAHLLFAKGSATATVDAISCTRPNWQISTLNLVDSTLPPSVLAPPSPPVPPTPTCNAGSLAGIAGYPCTELLGGFIHFHYHLSATELRARVRCPTCKGWVAIGFAKVPNSMIGGTAIVGGGTRLSVATYSLGGKKRKDVTRINSATFQLRDTTIQRDDGLTMAFTAKLGEGGVPATLSSANLLYGTGTQRELSYHGSLRGAATIEMVTLAPSASQVTFNSQRFGQAADIPSGGGGGVDNTLVGVLSTFGGFIVGVMLVVFIVKRRMKVGIGNAMLRDSSRNSM